MYQVNNAAALTQNGTTIMKGIFADGPMANGTIHNYMFVDHVLVESQKG